MRERRWEHQAHDEVAVETLTRELGVPPVVARLLCLRGLCDPDAAARFLSPRIAHLHDPWQLADMAKAVDRLLAAIDGRERGSPQAAADLASGVRSAHAGLTGASGSGRGLRRGPVAGAA